MTCPRRALAPLPTGILFGSPPPERAALDPLVVFDPRSGPGDAPVLKPTDAVYLPLGRLEGVTRPVGDSSDFSTDPDSTIFAEIPRLSLRIFGHPLEVVVAEPPLLKTLRAERVSQLRRRQNQLALLTTALAL